MTDAKIESYIIRDGDNCISGLMPGFARIPYNEFTHYIGWGMWAKEARALMDIHRSGTGKEKEWIEDVLEDINFHKECALLHRSDYEQLEELLMKNEMKGM